MNGVCCACCACTDAQVEACPGVTCTCSNDGVPTPKVCDVLGCDCVTGTETEQLATVLAILANEIDDVAIQLASATNGTHNPFHVSGIHPRVALRLQPLLSGWSATLRGLITE